MGIYVPHSDITKYDFMQSIKLIIVKLVTSNLGYHLLSLIKGKIVKRNGVVYDLSKLQIDNYTKALILLGLYEKSEIGMVNDHLPENTTVIELGSSIGITTCQIARIASRNVYSFEANLDLISKIEYNLGANNFKNVKVYNVALGDGNTVYFK
ncbi:MAG: hypothetical protein COA58_01555 [Bacteroidetes bacterium]|nr:MAG: hypothetical protein COA58_01555 [Bacteroidota bacterium]